MPHAFWNTTINILQTRPLPRGVSTSTNLNSTSHKLYQKGTVKSCRESAEAKWISSCSGCWGEGGQHSLPRFWETQHLNITAISQVKVHLPPTYFQIFSCISWSSSVNRVFVDMVHLSSSELKSSGHMWGKNATRNILMKTMRFSLKLKKQQVSGPGVNIFCVLQSVFKVKNELWPLTVK